MRHRRAPIVMALLTTALFVTANAERLSAQSLTFDNWLKERISGLAQVDVNSKAPEKQKDAPAASSSSTSLVDQSAASDFVSTALSLVPTTTSGGGIGSGSGNSQKAATITVSAYSLAALAKGKQLTDPQFYKDHTNLRKLYFTVGTADSKKEDDNSDSPATVLGVKWLIQNHQDIYSSPGKTQVNKVQDEISKAAAVSAKLKNRIQLIMFESQKETGDKDFATFIPDKLSERSFEAFAKGLKPGTLRQIDAAIAEDLATFSELESVIQAAYDTIRKGSQMALSATGTLRPDDGNDDYRGEFVFDKGLNERITWTINASFDFKDKKTAKDESAGRFATDFTAILANPTQAWGRSPLTLSFSAEGKWASGTKPTITGQLKLSVPIATGIELPVVYRFANRTALGNDSDAQARVGLSIDAGRLAHMFQ